MIGMPQKALCLGICSQSEISRIENNKLIPSSYVIQQISDKLNVSIEYFYEDNQTQRSDYFNDVKTQLAKARRLRNYNEIRDIIQIELKNPSIQKNIYMKKYLKWHEGIVLYMINQDKKAAIDILFTCIDINANYFSELEINILNSLGIFYRNDCNLEDATKYLEIAYDYITTFPLANKNRLRLKTSYNLSKVYTDSGLFDKSLVLCERGINICKNTEDMYLFAEFHYQYGRNWIMKGNDILGLEFWNKAKNILSLVGKQPLIKIIEADIEYYLKTKEVN